MMFSVKKIFFRLFKANPIVVKELRQTVRSRYIVGILLVFLFVLLVATGIAILTSSTLSIVNLDSALRAGRDMFQVLIVILTGACLFFIPTYTGMRLIMERNVSNMDLLFVTTISPGAIIRGKLLAGMVITVLMFSAAAPFMSFTYLLRGIDLPSIFIVLAFNFLIISVAIELAMCLACIPASKPFKTLMGIAFINAMITAVTILAAMESEMINEGIGSKLRSWDFWEPALVVVGILLSGSGFLHILSVAMISPPSANRSLPVRIYLAALWLVWGVVAMSVAVVKSEPDIIIAWLAPFVVFLSIGMLASISENPVLSNRIRRNIPRRRWLARLAFLFYTGPAGGIISNVLLATLTFCISTFCWSKMKHISSYGSFMEAGEVMVGIFLYVFSYAMSAVLFCRIFLRKRSWHRIAWAIALLLMAAGSVLPILVAFMFKLFIWKAPTGAEWYFLGNLFALAADNGRLHHIQFVSIFSIIVTLANLKWIMLQVRNFVPLKKSDQLAK